MIEDRPMIEERWRRELANECCAAVTDLPSYRQFLVTAGPVRRRRLWKTVSRFGDDLNPVVESHTEKEFWHLVVSVESTPAFLCALEQFEDHCERGPVGQTAFDRIVRWRTVAKVLSMGLVVRRCFPCSAGKS
jgi:hypothetical protein